MRSYCFKFFLWNHGNYGSVYLCSHLAVKFLCWDYFSETIGLCTVERLDVLWNGPVLLSIRQAVGPPVHPQLFLNTISWKPLIWLTSYFDMALLLLRPQKLFIWGILLKSRWPPQQFGDWHCTLCRMLFMNAVAWKPLVGLTLHFDMALKPLRPQTLLIWGILRKSRWLPQQFGD